MERFWKELLVYLDVTNFLDKKYEKYCGRPGNERIFRLGVQWVFRRFFSCGWQGICRVRPKIIAWIVTIGVMI